MATAINQAIPLTTLAVGTHSFGPFALNGHTQAVLSIDRTVANGLNSKPGVAIDFKITDGTWAVSGHVLGGQVFNKDDTGAFTVLVTTEPFTVTFPSTATSLTATLAVSGGSVAVQGSIAIT